MRRPLYFNPLLDSAYFEMGQRQLDFDCCRWLKYLKAHAPTLLGNIRSLEIRDLDFRVWGESSWNRAFKDGYYGFEDTILPFFPKLEALCFTSREAPKPEIEILDRMRLAREQAGLIRFQQDANTWYENQRAKYSQTEAVGDINFLVQRKANATIERVRTPKIICRPWIKLADGPFDPYAEEEEL